MKFHLNYFAWVREGMGCGSEHVDVPQGITTISDLIGWLAARDDRGTQVFADPARIRAALDGNMVDLCALLHRDGEVSLFPPVTGG